MDTFIKKFANFRTFGIGSEEINSHRNVFQFFSSKNNKT